MTLQAPGQGRPETKVGSNRPVFRADWSSKNVALRILAPCEFVAAWFFFLFSHVALFRLSIQAVAAAAILVTIVGVYGEFQQRKIDRGVRIAMLFAQIAELHALEKGKGLRPIVEVLARERVSMMRVDLSGADLTGVDLSGADLRQANFSGADLSGVDLSDANLTHADLSGANFNSSFSIATTSDHGLQVIHVDAGRANLSGADLTGATLSGANLGGANLANATLFGAKLQDAEISGGIHRDQLLTESDRKSAHPTNWGGDTHFFAADLSGANLLGADLSGANLSGANLSRANLAFASLSGANLGNSILGGADIVNAPIGITLVRDVNAVAANLSGAHLLEVNLRGANLSRVNFRGANLTSADLHGATGLSSVQLATACAAQGLLPTLPHPLSWSGGRCPD